VGADSHGRHRQGRCSTSCKTSDQHAIGDGTSWPRLLSDRIPARKGGGPEVELTFQGGPQVGRRRQRISSIIQSSYHSRAVHDCHGGRFGIGNTLRLIYLSQLQCSDLVLETFLLLVMLSLHFSISSLMNLLSSPDFLDIHIDRRYFRSSRLSQRY
jgi:hypothetical protein